MRRPYELGQDFLSGQLVEPTPAAARVGNRSRQLAKARTKMRKHPGGSTQLGVDDLTSGREKPL